MYIFSVFDLLPYIFLILFCYLLVVSKRIKNISNAYVIYCILLFFASIRYGIGYDYFSYKGSIDFDQPQYVYERLEPFSRLLINVSKFFDSSNLYFFLYSILILYPIYYVVKKNSSSPSLSLFIYLLFPSFFIDSMGIIRNALAFSMVFVAYHYLIRKKFLWYFIFCVFAGLCHNSGYISFILFPIYIFSRGKMCNLLFCVLCYFIGGYVDTIISIFPSSAFLNALVGYINQAKEVGSMKYLVLLIGGINFIYWDRLVKVRSENVYILNLISVGLCFFFLFILDDTLSYRLSNYFLLFIILLFPDYMLVFKKRYKKIVQAMIIMFFLSVLSVSFYINISGYLKGYTEKMNMLPYQTVFYHEKYSNYY